MGTEQLDYLFAADPNVYDLGLIHEFRFNWTIGFERLLYLEDSWKKWIKKENIIDRDAKDWIRHLSFDCAETIVYCIWSGNVFPCCDPQHAKEVFNQFGRCWSITPPIGLSETGRPVQRRPGTVLFSSKPALYQVPH